MDMPGPEKPDNHMPCNSCAVGPEEVELIIYEADIIPGNCP
jgi:hypothetical protein